LHAVNGDGKLHLALFSFPLFDSKAADVDMRLPVWLGNPL